MKIEGNRLESGDERDSYLTQGPDKEKHQIIEPIGYLITVDDG